MTKEELKWVKIRIHQLITNLKTNETPSISWERGWNAGYNSACEQILEMLEKTEKQ